MKTGRLLKFTRPGGEVHAYLYRESSLFRAALYVVSGPARRGDAVHALAGASETAVEHDVRSWVDEHFPKET
jgi:hypothetical protein